MTSSGESGGKGLRLRLDSFSSFIKFAIVGTIGIVVNEALLISIQSIGVYYLYADAVAIEASILSNFVLNDLWTFKNRRSGRASVRLLKFNLLMLAGLVVNLAVVAVGTGYFGMAAAISNLIGIAVAFLVRYALSTRYAWMKIESIEEGQTPKPVADPHPAPEPAA